MTTPRHLRFAGILLLCISAMACRSSSPEAPTTAAAASSGEEAAESETHSNTIKWSTASEVENFGYDVYRGDSPDGPFERLTEEPIEGAGTTDEVNHYSFVDDTIDPTEDYYYYVESISMAGVREEFTPVGRAKAKISTDAE